MKTSSPRKTVLVIEDDRPISQVIKGHLEGAGYQVLQAASGEEGLAAARSGGVDLITLDVLMEPQNGWRVFRALRNDAATCKIPVVFVTIIEERPEGVVGDGYVTKPFRGRDLIDVVARALSSGDCRSLAPRRL
jgi:DNA-binding response OmpR family regulator